MRGQRDKTQVQAGKQAHRKAGARKRAQQRKARYDSKLRSGAKSRIRRSTKDDDDVLVRVLTRVRFVVRALMRANAALFSLAVSASRRRRGLPGLGALRCAKLWSGNEFSRTASRLCNNRPDV